MYYHSNIIDLQIGRHGCDWVKGLNTFLVLIYAVSTQGDLNPLNPLNSFRIRAYAVQPTSLWCGASTSNEYV